MNDWVSVQKKTVIVLLTTRSACCIPERVLFLSGSFFSGQSTQIQSSWIMNIGVKSGGAKCCMESTYEASYMRKMSGKTVKIT